MMPRVPYPGDSLEHSRLDSLDNSFQQIPPSKPSPVLGPLLTPNNFRMNAQQILGKQNNYGQNLLFERRENVHNAKTPFFPKGSEKVSMFQTNKMKNQRSTLNFRQSPQDIELMMEEGHKNKVHTQQQLAELSKGITSVDQLGLEDSLRRRQISKLLLNERR